MAFVKRSSAPMVAIELNKEEVPSGLCNEHIRPLIRQSFA
jgi:hypothetical protein